MNSDGTDQTRLTNIIVPHLPTPLFVCSPDGSKIAFLTIGIPYFEINTINIDGSEQKIISNKIGDNAPVFSPDGTKIAFHSQRDGNFEIYIMNSDGSDQTNLTNNPNDDLQPVFQP